MASKALLAEIQTAVADYLENHKNLSIQSISNKTGVSYSTIRRILQHEANDLRDETILALILVVMPRIQRLSFLQTYYPSLGALLREVEADDGPQVDHEKLRLYRFKDPHNYVLKLSLSSNGTSRAHIFRLLGERGTTALDEMVEDKFLQEDSQGLVRFASQGSLMMNADDIVHQIQKDAEYYDKSLLGSPFARLAHMSASLSLTAYQELVELVHEFLKKCEKLKEGSEQAGEIPVFIDLMVNTYDRASLKGVS